MRKFKLFLNICSLLIIFVAFQNCSDGFNSNSLETNSLSSSLPEPRSTPPEEAPPIVEPPVTDPPVVTPPIVSARELTLKKAGQTLNGSSHTFSFSDSGAIDGVTRYDIWIEGTDYSTSVVAPATNIVAHGLPTDGKEYTITLRPPEGYTEDEFEPITAKFTAVKFEGDFYPLNFGQKNISYGALSTADVSSWIPGYRSASNKQNLSVVLEDGEAVLRHKYTPSSAVAEKAVFRYDIPHQRSYRIKYSVYFEPGFEWGSTSKQGGKLAFGLGGGSRPSGGEVKEDGFTARVMWRGNYLGGGKYDGTGRLVMYTYNADRNLSQSTVGLDTQFGDYNVPIGQWIDVVFEITMNSDISKSDGSMRGWINGNLLVNKSKIKWWSEGDKPRIDTLYYSSFYGGGSNEWAPPSTTYVKVRDVAIAPVIDGNSAIVP